MTDRRAPGHETSDMNAKYVSYFGIALTVSAIVIHIVVWLLFDYFIKHPQITVYSPTRIRTERVVPPEPKLQINPSLDWQSMVRQENEVLESYGWVDRSTGMARIPIERAMEIMVEGGGAQ
jgi:hypothetical protein